MAFPYFQVLIICLLGVQFCVFIYNALSYPKPVVILSLWAAARRGRIERHVGDVTSMR